MIGESRPANGTFFYSADSNLFSYTEEAFLQAYGGRVRSAEDFLKHFQRNGFYLVDLCDKPVNHLKGSSRHAARRECEARLSSQLANAPRGVKIVVIMKGIRGNVQSALASLGRHDLKIDASLDFPAQANQRRYVDGLTAFLRRESPMSADRRPASPTGMNAVPNGGGRVTLHEELKSILMEHGNRWMTTKEVADEVNRRERYSKRDGSKVTPFQVHGRTRQYSHMYERDGSRVRLRTH